MTARQSLDPYTFGTEQPCFGCSPHHPNGLHLRFEREGEEVLTTFLPGLEHQGPPGIMHGGLVTTLADELAAWAVVGLAGKFGFTAAMQARLLRPIRIGVPVEGRARLLKPPNRVAAVDVRLAQKGEEAFRGELTFALVDRAAAERMLGGPLPEAWARFCR